ncbi:VanZ family protein [Piscinibacter sakaiensis]|uniref:Putative transmembrane protein n=1 Tax=Piscinibacter sakaiensis TaxID=1547922 RepID=A0A0K8P4N2_PISS1|nr:VanZ family protein [Piscinibacter sakaiensis]GAP37566.1 putative transmembrane protein [Piscinibacter sakaiensis]
MARPVARHRSSAVPLTLLYGALIVYASLYPFEGWRWPSVSLGHYLGLPWPRWWTGFDLVSNLLGYMPFGALLFLAGVRNGWRARQAWLAATLAALLLSASMETLQNFLPQRVASNVDLALNTLGAALGAGLGVVAQVRGGIARWQTLRDRWFARRSAGGLVLLVLWPIGLLFPLPLPLGVGQVIPRVREAVLDALEGSSAEAWSREWLQSGASAAGLTPAGDFLAVALGLLGPCLLAYAISPPGWRRSVLCAGALVLGTGATTLSTALNFAPQHALTWATPAALSALAVGALLALLMAPLPRRAAAAMALVVLTALVALVTQAPTDPYYAQSLQGWEQGRFIRFHGAAQWVGWLWPYAAMVYLLTAIGAPRERPLRRDSQLPAP